MKMDAAAAPNLQSGLEPVRLTAAPGWQSTWSKCPVASWLADHGGRFQSRGDIIAGLAERLNDDGMHLTRITCGIGSVHPQVFAQTIAWRRGEGVTMIDRDLSIERTEKNQNSPVRVIREGASAIRRRLELPETPMDFPILQEFKESGITDYVGMALPFSNGQRHYIAFCTDRKGGFDTAALTHLYDLLPLITLRLEVNTTGHMMETLLATYLGPLAADRVLAGAVRRAAGEMIEAAILFSDLHDFTRITDMLPPRETLRVLDTFFDTVASAVAHHGGEMLKIIGDGTISIFPQNPVDPNISACQAAAAALEARRALAALDSSTLPDGVDKLWAGFGLHYGEVFFGNIGARDRLDFTAIGPAVNEAVRVEALCRTLGHDILTTEEFAGMNCGQMSRSVGTHVLKGVRQPRELYAIS